MQSIVEAVLKYALDNPAKVCLIDENVSYTYGEVAELVKSYCSYLKEEGVTKGDKVVVECTQNARFLIIDLALELLGAVFVPVEMNVSEDRLNSILDETNSTTHFSMARINQIEIESATLDEFDFPDGDEIAEILYTTGTTGKSKGIVLTHKNNVAVAQNIIGGTKMKADNVELIPLPISHSHGLRTCYANFLNGSSVVIVNGVMRVKKWIKMLREYKITALDLSPTAARALIKVTRGNMDEFKELLDYVEIGTAALDEDLKGSLCELLPNTRLYNFYGSTESGRVSTYDFNSEKGLMSCIGYPSVNAKFVVTDEQRNPIKSSEDNMGMLAISGPMNMKEYFMAPELTEQTLKDGYILTNDIVYIDQTGKVYMVGRQGSVINYMGIKIAPEEIESVAVKFDSIADCACVPAKDSNGFEVPKLFVVVDKNEVFDKQAFREFLRQELDSNKLPQIIEEIDEIPRAGNGKILRNKLIQIV